VSANLELQVICVKKQRFLFVDGLRGIAALAVVLYHFLEAVSQTAEDWIWPVFEQLFSYGYLGVDIFFVISGFVIPLSVRNAEHTPGFLLRFAIRRSIRLDPPYWLTIFLELIAIKLGLMLFPALDTPFPSVESILAHFVYAQELLGFSSMNAVFWTLCYEVQFYIVFVGALVLARALRRRLGDRTTFGIVCGLGIMSFLWSVTIFFTPVETPVHGLFIDRWYQFLLGFLALQCCQQKRMVLTFMLASALIFAATMLYFRTGADNGLSALVVAWLLVAAARREKMAVWLSGRVIQFLGRISYSLYLIHPVIGWRFIKLLRELHGVDFTPLEAWLAFGAGVGISVLSAWLMYKAIEAPALKVCHQIRMDRPLTMGDIRRSIQILR